MPLLMLVVGWLLVTMRIISDSGSRKLWSRR
jgi:hypothetical protein